MKTLGDLVRGRENREVYHLRPEMTVRDAARFLTERRIGAVAVLDGTRLAGVLSERDVVGRVVAPGRDPDATHVADVMTRDLVVGRAGDTREEGARVMKQAGCRHLPVVDGDQLLGMISLRDLLQVDLSQKDEEIRWLNAYIHFVPPPGGPS